MIHVAVREDEILDRLARIFGLRRIDGPARLNLIDWGIENDKTVDHRHDQVVGGATPHLLDQLLSAVAIQTEPPSEILSPCWTDARASRIERATASTRSGG